MENANKKELILLINKQKEQLSRYENRLRDVVTAYKGLIKEKEALEASLKALSGPAVPDKSSKSGSHTDNNETKTEEVILSGDTASDLESSVSEDANQNETVEHLHSQLTTLTNSLATLSAEKSRMEAGFQADKKQLRAEREERDKTIKDLQEKYQQSLKVHQSEIESMRSKLKNERHEREKEQNDHGVMIRELQKLLAEERRLKELQENEIEGFKSKFSQLEAQSGQKELYEKKLRDVHNELEATHRKLKRLEAKAKETPPLLLQLQDEMANMKLQHQAAIFEEQKRATDAEERARHLAAVHEERVANLEARLAELSETVGNYDRLRQQDQMAIHKLKDHIAQLDLEQTTLSRLTSKEERKEKGTAEADWAQDIDKTQWVEKPANIQEMIRLIDCLGIKNDLHKSCQEEYDKLKLEYEQYKQLHSQQPDNKKMEESPELSSLRMQLKTLKDRIVILNGQLEDTDTEWREKVNHVQQLLKAEKMKHKEELNAMDLELRSRLSLLEQQLQKQRERSLCLLEEKEQEIQTLKSTFQMFLPGNARHDSPTENIDNKEVATRSGNVMDNLSQFGRGLGPSGGGESPHMLHYAHELARRDVEICNLRKAKHQTECTLRELQRTVATEQERHREEKTELIEEVERLQRCQSREGANLEYLKNVVLSFLLTSDTNSKRHMLNAIAAVLKFSSSELEKVSCTHRPPAPAQGNIK